MEALVNTAELGVKQNLVAPANAGIPNRLTLTLGIPHPNFR